MPDVPQFEAHFNVRAQNGIAMEYSTYVIVDVASSCGIPVHQAVRFEPDGGPTSGLPPATRVIVTSYFGSYEELMAKTGAYSKKLKASLRKLDKGLRVLTVGERILLCLRPRLAGTSR